MKEIENDTEYFYLFFFFGVKKGFKENTNDYCRVTQNSSIENEFYYHYSIRTVISSLRIRTQQENSIEN